jgi:hypothetical protein
VLEGYPNGLSLFHEENVMLRISVTDNKHERRLILEGVLSSVWVAELRKAWKAAQLELENRDIVVDVTEVTLVSSDGEELLCELINEGAKFRGGGVYVGHLLRELEMMSKRLREVKT